MKLDILSIGDELLIGHTLNTNAFWMAKQLNEIGFEVRQQTTISDEHEHIRDTVDNALNFSDVVLITGGLGPTNDDLTMPVLNEYFGGRLVTDEKVYQHIQQLVEGRGFTMNANNKQQAVVPDNCTVIFNKLGTAPGLWFEKEGKVVVAMPGVPHEMKAMVTDQVIPRLKEKYHLPEIVHRMVYTQGIIESVLAEKIGAWEQQLPSDIKLAYLPSPGIVKLRLTAVGDDRGAVERLIEGEVNKLQGIIPDCIYAVDERSLEEVVGQLLKESGKTIAVAESCTGGYISHLITKVPGSSTYYKGSVVPYANEIKEQELHIDKNLILAHGAVSKAVVEQMAQNVRAKFQTDFALATSGIAGPTGGSVEKPVGTVWIGIAYEGGVEASVYQLGKDREVTIRRTARTALGLLKDKLSKG